MNEEAMTPDKEQVVEPLTTEEIEDIRVRGTNLALVDPRFYSLWGVINRLLATLDAERGPRERQFREWKAAQDISVAEWQRQIDAARTASVAGLDRERLADLRQTIRDGVEAFRLTREYVGEDTLPAIEGWSWFDWTQKALAAFNSAPSIEQEPGLCAATNPTETWGVMWCGLYAGHPLGGPDNGHHWFSDRVTPQPRAADAE